MQMAADQPVIVEREVEEGEDGVGAREFDFLENEQKIELEDAFGSQGKNRK